MRYINFCIKLIWLKNKNMLCKLYTYASMDQKSFVTIKKTSIFARNWLTAKMYTFENYHFDSNLYTISIVPTHNVIQHRYALNYS